MGKNSSQTTTQKTVSAPWKPSQPYLTSQMAGAGSWRDSSGAKEVYSGPRVAGMSGETASGIDALSGSAGTQQTQDYLSRVLSGDYLSAGNPHQADLDRSIRAAVMPGVNSQFSNAGMTGSTTNQAVLTRALTDGLAAPRYQNYQNERAMQMQAAGMLPGVDNTRAQQLLTAGQTREGYDQREIEAAREAFEEQRTAGLRPYLETQPIFGQIGSMGGTSSGTSTQTSKPSLGQSIIGAGLMGASLLTPWAAGAGAAAASVPGLSGNWGAVAPYGSLPWQK